MLIKKRLKIAVFNYDNSSNPWAGGGASEYNNEILRLLANDFDITMYTSWNREFQKPRTVNGITYYPLSRGNFYFNSKLQYTFSAIKKMRNLDADVVMENWFYPFPLMLQFFTKKPVILICHGTYGWHSLNKFGLLGLPVFLMEKLYRIWYRWLTNVSPSSLAEFVTQNKVLVPPGLNADFLHYKPKVRPAGKYISMLCRIDIYQKGLDIVRKIASQIPYEIHIAGGGHRLKKFKASVKAKNVTFIGPVSGKAKVKFLEESLFMLMPSRYEGFGISGLEAQAVGKPVVGFDVNDLNFCVKKNFSGLLAKPYSSKELLQNVLTLLKDRTLLVKLGKQARRHSLSFSYKKSAATMKKLILKNYDASRTRA